jgi:hypothetical protein
MGFRNTPATLKKSGPKPNIRPMAAPQTIHTPADRVTFGDASSEGIIFVLMGLLMMFSPS